MKKLVLAAMTAASMIALAGPAAAAVGDATGTINISGSVASRCTVIPSGGGTSSTFGANVALGELAKADGTLQTTASLEALFNAGGTAASAMAFRVVCTTAAPTVAVDATQITTGAGDNATAGYANRINYQANVGLTLVSGSQTVSNDSANAATAATALTGRLAGTGNNVVVTAQNFRTPAATDLLEAGSYTGQVVITIAPGA